VLRGVRRSTVGLRFPRTIGYRETESAQMCRYLRYAVLLGLLQLCSAQSLFSQSAFIHSAPADGSINKSNAYSVSGCVNHPGLYEWREGVTVLNAIRKSGGLSECSEASNIFVWRGHTKLRCIYRHLVSGEIPSENISLLPGDAVHVK